MGETRGAKVEFDAIHTQKKQTELKSRMSSVAEIAAAMDNPNTKAEFCPVCGSRDLGFYVRAYHFDMSRCEDCQLIFCDPYPTAGQLHFFYNSEMKDFENEFFRETFEARVKLFGPRVEIIGKIAKGPKILDVGAAIGVFIEALERSQHEFDVSVCDLSENACAELSQRYPAITVHNCDVSDLDIDEKFDIITLWDTIEHLVDQHSVLEKLRTLLSDDGVICFSTPNTNSFEWLVAGRDHVQILPPGHVNLLNSKNIPRLAGRAGLEVVDIHTLNASLDIGYVRKLTDKCSSKGEPYVDGFMRHAIFDEVFCELLESYLVNNRMAGNAMAICKAAKR